MTRFYRALLHLYPTRFRQEYGSQLENDFAERTSSWSAPRRAVTALFEVIPDALGAHWDVLRHGAAAGTTWSGYGSDIRYALRQIRSTPLFSGVIIGVLALGIAINAGMATLLKTYVWQPAPGIPADPALARLLPTARDERTGRQVETTLTYAELAELRTHRDAFLDVAGWAVANLAVDIGSGVESINARFVTSNYFGLLRAPVVAGPGLPANSDEVPALVAVIPHAMWQSRFGGRDDVIGSTIRVMNQPVTIVGVAPLRFAGVNMQNQGEDMIWLPLGARSTFRPALTNSDRRLVTVARVAPGLSAEEAASRIPPSRYTMRAERLTGARPSRDRTELLAACGFLAALIILITCTNVSALLLGRAAARRREIAVRLALGATRGRILRQLLTESLVIAGCGAALALAIYIPSIRIGYAVIPALVYGFEPQPATFAYAALSAVIATVVFGLAPALHATGAQISEAIKNGGSASIGRARFQSFFVVAQLACSAPVLVVTSMALTDIRANLNRGADEAPSSVLTMMGTLYQMGAADGLARMETIRDRVKFLPGVERVGVSTTGIAPAGVVVSRGFASFEMPDGSPAQVGQYFVSPDYFEALGMPVVRGRAIGVDENRKGALTVVVSQAAANRLWPGQDAVGKRFVRRGAGNGVSETLEVIGVVAPAAYDATGPYAMVYAPLATAPTAWITGFAIRTRGDARSFVPQLRAAIREVEPFVALSSIETKAEGSREQRQNIFYANAGAFAVGTAALLLASLGLYAIIAFAVAQRKREIGVRLAMGASPGRVVREFFTNGIRVSAIGMAIGIPLTVAGIRIVKASLLGFNVQSFVSVGIVVPVLIAVAALASWIPARRAGEVDPLIALRAE